MWHFNKHAACQGIIASFFRWEYRSLMSRSAARKCDPGTSAQQKQRTKNKKALILRALFLYHIFKQTGAVPINGVSGYFTPDRQNAC